MESPNLFSFATSELSQDAFICWLLAWADEKYKTVEQALHQTGTKLLDRLLEVGKVKKPSAYSTVEIKRQHKNIDVLILVNNDIAVIIEDKTHTKAHSDQLKRYREIVKQDFPDREIAAIYFKTGDQSHYEKIKNDGYHCFLRKDFLYALQQGIDFGVTNNIFIDYRHYLQAMDNRVNEYLTLPIDKWHHDCSIGFFIELKQQLGKGNWGYVSNPSGGFMGFWWLENRDRFLLLENSLVSDGKETNVQRPENSRESAVKEMTGKLCFKIKVKEKSEQSAKWQSWYDALMIQEEQTPFDIQKPRRRRKGVHMTVAINNKDYRQTNDEGILDMEKTVVFLRKAETFLDAAEKSLNGNS